MGLMQRARADARKILGDLAGWATILTLTNPDGETAVINGTFFKCHVAVIGMDGTPVNARQIHITFAEAELVESYYTCRNVDGKVHMEGHLVTATDSTGLEETYIIREWHPDETLGIIRCMLGNYTQVGGGGFPYTFPITL